MLTTSRFLIVAALFGAAMPADDIAVPLEDGKITIQDVHFIRVEEGSYIPELSFKIENHTSSPWWVLKLHFDITGICNGTARRWSIPATTSLGWSADLIVGNAYRETDDSLAGKLDGCHSENISATLGLAQNGTTRILGTKEAKKEAAEAAQRKRLVAERDARVAKYRAEEEAKAAEERKKIRTACSVIYQKTADTKLKDLTVKEEQQVRACQSLGLYPPQ
jgi:hypothetical protein